MTIIAYWAVVALAVAGAVWFSGYNRRKIEKVPENPEVEIPITVVGKEDWKPCGMKST